MSFLNIYILNPLVFLGIPLLLLIVTKSYWVAFLVFVILVIIDISITESN